MKMPVVVFVLAGFACMIYWFLCIVGIYLFLSKRLFRKHPDFRQYIHQGLKPDWSFADINKQDLFISYKFRAQFAICGLLAAIPMVVVILAVAAAVF